MTQTVKKEVLKNNINWEKFILSTTLSSSGWRRIFNSKNDPESLKKHLDNPHTTFISLVGEVAASYFKKNRINPIIAVGRDSRPTGKVISEIIFRKFIECKVQVFDLGVIALPQCSSTVKANRKLSGFIFITASHNPPGYNGIKIGNHRGEIIPASTNQKLVSLFKKKLFNIKKPLKKTSKIKNLKLPLLPQFNAAKDYRISLLNNMGYQNKTTNIRLQSMIKTLSLNNYAIGCDFNGSARIKSIDKSLINELGIYFLSCNNTVGKFSHNIVPEQKSLDTLRKKMASSKWNRYRLLFGYVVDCDGDRGNIVINTKSGNFTPDAQTTFALSVLAELCFLEAFFPQRLKKTVIVANDPTSLRVDILTDKFGVKVARAEVGEANIISLAQKLRRQEKLTPVMGEGSNGGSIIHPAVVRDPLSMVTSLIKLLFLDNGKISLRNIAVNKLKLSPTLNKVPAEFFLGKIIPYINTHYSTSVFEPSALIKIPYSTQKKFKHIYEQLWAKKWNKEKKKFDSWGIKSYEILNYEGIHTYLGMRNRHGNQDGGHKISFFDDKKKEIGYIWFRFSKTEPVLRLSAEHHSLDLQKKLFSLQKEILNLTAKEDSCD